MFPRLLLRQKFELAGLKLAARCLLARFLPLPDALLPVNWLVTRKQNCLPASDLCSDFMVSPWLVVEAELGRLMGPIAIRRSALLQSNSSPAVAARVSGTPDDLFRVLQSLL